VSISFVLQHNRDILLKHLKQRWKWKGLEMGSWMQLLKIVCQFHLNL
jgi:hypothetical protein